MIVRPVQDGDRGAWGGLARARGRTVLPWIAAEDNAPARAPHDRVAGRTPWLTYEIEA